MSDTQPEALNMIPLLHVRHLDVWDGDIPLVRDMSLDVYDGEIVSIIGPNGAGKSTLCKAIYGFIKPREGQIRFSAANITGLEPHEILTYGIAYVPEIRSTFPDMTVEENLLLGMYLVQDRRRERTALLRVFDIFPRLADRRHQKARTLSGGEQRLLEIGRALMPQPRLLILDEPSMGLAPVIVKQMFTSIYTLNKDFGATILMVEQNGRQALEISHRGYVMDAGHKLHEGNSRALLHSPNIQQIYLGR